jgi:hypothetical protein
VRLIWLKSAVYREQMKNTNNFVENEENRNPVDRSNRRWKTNIRPDLVKA